MVARILLPSFLLLVLLIARVEQVPPPSRNQRLSFIQGKPHMTLAKDKRQEHLHYWLGNLGDWVWGEVPSPTIYKRETPGMLFILLASFFSLTCKMGVRVTHLGSIFPEALMYSRTQIGTQEAFIK